MFPKLSAFLFSSLFISFLFVFSAPVSAQETLSLQGKWRFALDGNFKDWPRKMGVEREWFKGELPSNSSLELLNHLFFKNNDFLVSDSIYLPGSTDESGIGVPLVLAKPFTIGLERKLSYDGAFWVQKSVSIPTAWSGKRVTLYLERLLGGSTVYWDDKYVGKEFGLAYGHQFVVDTAVTAGVHRLTILVDKEENPYQQYGHHVVNGNGISWNGIVGKIELHAADPLCTVSDFQIFPKISSKSVNIISKFNSQQPNTGVEAQVVLREKNSKTIVGKSSFKVSSDSIMTAIPITSEIALWSEFNPALYTATITLLRDAKPIEEKTVVFGFRDVGTSGGNISINGEKVFIRGTLDNGVSPLTGYPAMDVAAWAKKFRMYKDYGINLIRFHTHFPPKAAFIAADSLGMYLQPELAGVPYAEIDKVLTEYGNHPSFCMMSLNNEAFSHNELTQKFILGAKAKDNRHLYTCTTHPMKADCVDDFYVSAWGTKPKAEWPHHENIVGITWGGGDNVTASRFNTHNPETSSDYSEEISGANAPVISHEVGQWALMPDFNDIPKYSGSLRNTNFERMKTLFEGNHNPALAHKFHLASGEFSALVYKEEIESALRTPHFGGFELLGLQDYQGQWTAIVGLFNDFMESKGLVSSSEHSQYCNAVVPLAKLEKRVFTSNEEMVFTTVVANYSLTDIPDCTPTWTLKSVDGIVASGDLVKNTINRGGLTQFPEIKIPLNSITKSQKLELTISIPGTNYQNSWDIWVYIPYAEVYTDSIVVIKGNEKAKLKEQLEAGKKVLLLLTKDELNNYRESCFAPIFWNSFFKWPQKSHTLGVYCDPEHPVFNDFPTEFHSNWQWWDITMNAVAMNLNALPKEFNPLINVIDTYHKNDKLGYLFECNVGKGKLVVSSIDFTKSSEKNISTQRMFCSVVKYMEHEGFSPKHTLELESIYQLMK